MQERTEFVSRETVLRDILCEPPDAHYPSWYAEKLKQVPAADAVEVVRCKDCRFFYNGYDEKCCINHKGVVVTDENGYCHHAEKRSDNGD